MSSKPGCELIVIAMVAIPVALNIIGLSWGREHLRVIGAWLTLPLLAFIVIGFIIHFWQRTADLKDQKQKGGKHMKPFTTLAVVVLVLAAAGHLVRLIFGWEIIFNGRSIPLWLSAVGLVLAAGLAFMVWRESRTPGQFRS